MKQLDPKAVYLFFVRYVFIWIGMLVLFVGLIVAPYFIGKDFFVVETHTGWWIGPIIMLILFFVCAKLTYKFYKYELRDDGFRKEHGVISKTYVTIPYDRIQNVDIYRGILARILGLSDLNIQTAGTSAVVGRYGAAGIGAEGRLPGLSREVAEQLRDELINRARQSKNQGL